MEKVYRRVQRREGRGRGRFGRMKVKIGRKEMEEDSVNVSYNTCTPARRNAPPQPVLKISPCTWLDDI